MQIFNALILSDFFVRHQQCRESLLWWYLCVQKIYWFDQVSVVKDQRFGEIRHVGDQEFHFVIGDDACIVQTTIDFGRKEITLIGVTEFQPNQ